MSAATGRPVSSERVHDDVVVGVLFNTSLVLNVAAVRDELGLRRDLVLDEVLAVAKLRRDDVGAAVTLGPVGRAAEQLGEVLNAVRLELRIFGFLLLTHCFLHGPSQ